MQVIKFGGTSIANAQRMMNVAEIIESKQKESRVGVVISAVAGVTNFLDGSIKAVLQEKAIEPLCQQFLETHRTIVSQLEAKLQTLEQDALIAYIDNTTKQLQDYLTGIHLLGECPPSIYAAIIILGERVSVKILYHLLRAKRIQCAVLNSEECIVTNEDYLNAKVNTELTYARFDMHQKGDVQVLLMAGFIAGSAEGKTTTLGRNGSDFSGALMAVGLKAELFEIWTDVDGIYSTDPNLVHDAVLIDEMSYEEAMELSFFGAKVLHPKTIAPIAAHHIPTRIKNALLPEAPGTFIHRNVKANDDLLRGISFLENVAMLSVSGSGMKGIPGIATRIFGAISRREISLILITQSSSEYTIGFCVDIADAQPAKEALEDELRLELDAQLIESIESESNLAVISVVGDGMKTKRGVAGKFFSSLASVDVNVVAISQGAAERSISTVVASEDATRAVRIAHQFFFHSLQEINIFLYGVGTVGSSLLEQIHKQQKELYQQKINVKVAGIANSKKAVFSTEGIALDNWKGTLVESQQQSSIASLIDFQNKEKLINGVFVDCTSSEKISLSYDRIFTAGLHIATPNKKANTDKNAYYHNLRFLANERGRKFLYETNVGAGLPVIDTLQNLMKSGDALIGFEGILSGSLSYIFGLLDEGHSFSEAVTLAMKNGFTEPDPRDDLSGMDVARKLLILFRESGFHAEIEDIHIEPILPAQFAMEDASIAEFLEHLPACDEHFKQQVEEAASTEKVLRCVGEIKEGLCSVSIRAVDVKNPLYHIKGGENALAFTTSRYHPIPLVIRGYGAGADVTAAGVFADILRTVSWNPTTHHGH